MEQEAKVNAVAEETNSEPKNQQANRINIAGDTVTQTTANLPDEQRKLLRWAFDFARSNEWDWDDITRNFKVSRTTLYRVWVGKYKDSKTGEDIALDSVCGKIEKFKRIADQRGSVRKLPFVETSVWRRIERICEEALVTQTIGFIFGDSQIGKTTCLEEYQRRNNHGQTVFVTMPPAAGVQLMAKEIAKALFLSPDSCFDKHYSRILRALDGEKLLIIDEAHMAFETYQKLSIKRCLATLRHIHDKTKCGMVISATNVFRDEMERGEFAQSMKQFKRRGTLVLQLPSQAPEEDLLKIAAHYGLGEPQDDAWEVVENIAKNDGLGKYTKYLGGAARMASKKEQKLAWHHFLKYHDITSRMAMEVK